MRFFVQQTNYLVTDPVIDSLSKVAQTTAVVTAKLYEGDTLVEDSDVTLSHVGNGVYQGQWPVLDVIADEPNQTKYEIEFSITISGNVVHYLRGPITAVLRTQNDV